jgi:regulator-associated protein of mTOR
LCVSLRKNAKDERVLFHYNGHGVPRPTANGEIWVFNKEFTQYIPLSLYDVLSWMGSPSIYVWDCSSADLCVQNFINFERERENELKRSANQQQAAATAAGTPLQPQPPIPKIIDSIHLAACGLNEVLPMLPDLPMDIFTACLTTPIRSAIHWYVSQKKLCKLIPGLTIDLLEKIPGQINDRRTMMGELNWIFTAITDTIAWNLLDSDLFQKLFRQDLLVASLFRNFLLAERIMKSVHCNPVSHPALPPTNEHPLWQAWDLALDMCISQLPQILNGSTQKEFVSCGFFSEQIEIFDTWLKYNASSCKPPEQLPIVLQILLSQQHRLKALELLAKFLDFGPWAVSAALSVGIFPYVLKLITTQPKDLRPLLTFIWAKILAVDKSCQAELAKDNGHVYFIHVLSDPDVEPTYKVYSAFVLSCLVDNFSAGKEFAKQNHLISTCHYILTDKNSRDFKNNLLRQWCCICLGLSWQNYAEARWEGVRNLAHQNLIELIHDPVPEVRAAAIFALGTYIGCGQGTEADVEQTNKIDAEIVNALIKRYDSVFLIRKELIAALYNYVNQFLTQTLNNHNNSMSSLTGSESMNSVNQEHPQSSGIGSSISSAHSNQNIPSQLLLRQSQSTSALHNVNNKLNVNQILTKIQENSINSNSKLDIQQQQLQQHNDNDSNQSRSLTNTTLTNSLIQNKQPLPTIYQAQQTPIPKAPLSWVKKNNLI